MDSVLHDVYFNLSSPACFSGLNKVLTEARKRDPSITLEDVKTFLEKQDTYTLHKPVQRKFPRNKTIAVGIDSDWQADLCEMKSVKKFNDGFTYILTVIDVLSKYAWAEPIPNKKPESVVEAFKKILKESGRKPWRLLTDKGNEFRGKPFQDFVAGQNIKYLQSESPDIKASVAERYNRTLKARLWKYFTQSASLRYIEALPKLVTAINHSYHRSIKCRPVDVTLENEQEIWERLYGQKLPEPDFKFNIGDKVRIAQYKHVFKKGYLPNFTQEIFTVVKQLGRYPPVYQIEDLNSEAITGIFYEHELVKVVKPEEIYKIEKIIKTRKRKGETEHFVKWLGYPSKFNQWINQSDLTTT